MWDRYKKYLLHNEELGLTLDISTVPFPDDYLPSMTQKMAEVFAQMKKLEGGAIANPDEGRMVGHYWLRAPQLAPRPEIRQEIEGTIQSVKQFARRVHSGEIRGQKGRSFVNYLLLGIGDPAWGPGLSPMPWAVKRINSRLTSSITRIQMVLTGFLRKLKATWTGLW